MARTKITKTETTDEVKDQIIEEPVKQKRKFNQEDLIECHSVTIGKLFVPGSKSGNMYRFEDYGSMDEIEYRDLVALIRANSSYLFHPYLIVDDDDFVEEFSSLSKFYKEAYTMHDLEKIIDMDEQDMLAAIEVLPKGAKENLKNIVVNKILNRSIDSVKKIQMFGELFEIDFNLISVLFNK